MAVQAMIEAYKTVNLCIDPCLAPIRNQPLGQKAVQICIIGTSIFSTLALMAFYVNGITMFFLAGTAFSILNNLTFGYIPIADTTNFTDVLSKISMVVSFSLATLALFINPVSLLFITIASTFCVCGLIINDGPEAAAIILTVLEQQINVAPVPAPVPAPTFFNRAQSFFARHR